MSRSLLKATAVTGGMTLISRISGLVRDIVFARLIGAGSGIAADAFYVAFRIPNFLRRIFAEGAFSQAFVPVFSQVKGGDDVLATRQFLNRVTGVFALVLFVVTLIGTLAAPYIVMALAPGYVADPHKYSLTVTMLRIMFPYLMFISLVAMAGGILNTYGRFGLAAFTPVLLNVCLIAAALLVAPRMQEPVLALAWGVFVAGMVQLLFQLPALHRLGLLPRPQLHFRDPAVRRMFKLMLPATFSVSVAQVNLLVNTLLASFLVTGSVSWLYYADRLMEFPLGVFGVALGTVILPSLSRDHARASAETFSHTLDWALRIACFISVPAMVALAILADALMITLFQYGKFNAHDVTMAASALVAFAIGLPAFVLIKVLAPGFYARQDMKTPVRIGVISVIVNIVASLVLVFQFRHVGLALATTIAAVVNAALLYRGLRARGVYRPDGGWPGFLLRIAVAAAAMGALLWWDGADSAKWLNAPALERILRLAFWVVAGMLTYMAVAIGLGINLKQLFLRPRT